MNRFLYGLCLALGLTLCYNSSLAALDEVSPVVNVQFPDGHGSGFYVGKHIFITAGHVVQGEDEDTLVIAYENGFHAVKNRVLIYDYVHDYSVIYSEDSVDTNPLLLACKSPAQVGDQIRVLGYPVDFEKVQSTFGRVSSVHNKWLQSPDIDIADVTVAPGVSGGPVLNADGDVVGIAVGWLETTGYAAYVPISWICQLQVRDIE